MKKFLCITIVFLNLISVSIAQKKGQKEKNKRADLTKTEKAQHKNYQPIFKSDSVLNMTIKGDWKLILKDRADEPAKYPVEISYWGSAKKKQKKINATVNSRGNFRRLAENCAMPPLMVHFKKGSTKNSLFRHQDRMKLVTHCVSKDNILQEYVVYKMYQLLHPISFRTRLVNITYLDTTGKRNTETKMGILIEDEDDLATRHGLKLIENRKLNQTRLDTTSIITTNLFQYMIGNTDFSIMHGHNTKMLGDSTKKPPIIVPYDFDHSGIVEAKYARPAEVLNLRSTRERLYRGFSYPKAVFEPILQIFRNNKNQFYALYQNTKGLDPSYVKRCMKYLDEFYEMINNPKRFEEEILDAGKINEMGGTVKKSLD